MNTTVTPAVVSQSGAETHTARRLVPLLVVVASIGYICRVGITVVAPGIMADFHLSQQQMGEVFSAFLVGYTAFQVPSGWLADRMKARSLFLILLAGWALLTAATAAAGLSWLGGMVAAIPALLAIRALFGVIAAPTYPASARTVARNVPTRLQGRANGAVLASIGIGSALTPVLLGAMSLHWGWRAALLVTAATTSVVALVWAWLAPAGAESGVPAPGAKVHETGPGGSRSPLLRRSFWALTASYTLQGYVGYIFVFWFYLYLVQVRHFELMKAAWLTTLPWVSTLIAIPAGGIVSDLAVRRWGATWGRRSVPLAALVASAVLLVWGARTESAAIAVGALALSTALVLSSEGPFWATVNHISDGHGGVGGGVMNFGSNLGGMISPVATPWLAARIGWAPALTLTAALAAIAGVMWLAVRVDAKEDAS